MKLYLLISFLLISVLSSCDVDKLNPFKTDHPHAIYARRLEKAGLIHTSAGSQWIAAAEASLRAPLGIKLPYAEEGYFSATLPDATAIAFEAKRGSKIVVEVIVKAQRQAILFTDLWRQENGENKLLGFTDSTGRIEYEVEENGTYIVRLQPELLQSLSYRLTINAGPSLAFPVKKGYRSHIGSLWGVERDGGARRHEGIDIFAPLGTPAIAASDGLVTAVNENRLGGKVVWLRPKGRSITLYYAHLDSQIAYTGQRIKAGDVVGLIGNTGNARTTPPHLHFGIYTSGGAVDPLPFVDPNEKEPAKISASTIWLGKEMRLATTVTSFKSIEKDDEHTASAIEKLTWLKPIAATANKYKVILPDGSKGFVAANVLNPANIALKKLSIKQPLQILDAPDEQAAVKGTIRDNVSMLAAFNNYYYISDGSVKGWVHRSHFN